MKEIVGEIVRLERETLLCFGCSNNYSFTALKTSSFYNFNPLQMFYIAFLPQTVEKVS